MVVSPYSKQDVSPNTFLGIVWSGQNSPALTNFPVALHTSLWWAAPYPNRSPGRKVMVWGSPLVQDPLPQDKCSFPALAAASNSASRELSTWRTVRAGRLHEPQEGWTGVLFLWYPLWAGQSPLLGPHLSVSPAGCWLLSQVSVEGKQQVRIRAVSHQVTGSSSLSLPSPASFRLWPPRYAQRTN